MCQVQMKGTAERRARRRISRAASESIGGSRGARRGHALTRAQALEADKMRNAMRA